MASHDSCAHLLFTILSLVMSLTTSTYWHFLKDQAHSHLGLLVFAFPSAGMPSPPPVSAPLSPLALLSYHFWVISSLITLFSIAPLPHHIPDSHYWNPLVTFYFIDLFIFSLLHMESYYFSSILFIAISLALKNTEWINEPEMISRGFPIVLLHKVQFVHFSLKQVSRDASSVDRPGQGGRPSLLPLRASH